MSQWGLIECCFYLEYGGNLMSQHEQSQGGHRDEPKEKRAIADPAVGIQLYFP
jgi:hypothetical protein